MPQRAVNVNITDWKTGGTFSGGTVDFVSKHPTPAHFPQVLTLQVQDSSGEWIDVSGLSNIAKIEHTPTGLIVELREPEREVLTVKEGG